MQYTPESFFIGDKDQPCYDDCFDSGYSGLFCTPQSITRDGSLALGDETPKENLHLPVTPKDKTGNLTKDLRASCWCETPKVYKRDASLQYRLAVCKSILDAKANAAKSPRKKSLSVSGQRLSNSLDSLDTVIGNLATSTLSPNRGLPQSGRKRRLFSLIRTSTLDDGTLNSEQQSSFDGRVSLSDTGFNESCSPINKTSTETPRTNSFHVLSAKNLHSPVCKETNNPCDDRILCIPSGLQTPKCTRSMCEDTGFSSLTLDKSQDSSVDHDGSFQELLLSASKGNGVTPNLLDTKRRSWLQRQSRLSTLKEGGSHSDDDPSECNSRIQNLKEEEVFTAAATPHRVLSLKSENSISSDGVASTKRDFVTPLRRSSAKGEMKTPLSSGSFISDVTPSNHTPANLSLTPALELVHAMCQQKAQSCNGQSPSVKNELRSTTALVQTPINFRTTLPLAGLIGRKIGVGTVDILTELNKRNLKHILSLIMGHLTPKCIYRCGRVCKSWKKIIQQDRRASIKRRSHLSELNDSLEQVVAPHVPEADTRATLLQRSALKTVQSQSRRSCTPQSGSRSLTPPHNSTLHSGSSSKRDKFLEVAKTLFNDECLKPCPRCQHPARCHSVKGEGVCSSENCAFRFCTSCLCAFHGSRECGSQSANRRKNNILIPGSAQSKRNIRRL